MADKTTTKKNAIEEFLDALYRFRNPLSLILEQAAGNKPAPAPGSLQAGASDASYMLQQQKANQLAAQQALAAEALKRKKMGPAGAAGNRILTTPPPPPGMPGAPPMQ